MEDCRIFQEIGNSQRRSKLMLDAFVWLGLGEREKAHSSMCSWVGVMPNFLWYLPRLEESTNLCRVARYQPVVSGLVPSTKTNHYVVR